ncbi:ATP-binding cassette domain-containing protein [Oceanithermus sp.]|uniref:ABC transporter ATP-binding protein n=1 Tax=Oceanithermus sp. TaxID=2268145 RepID=UPI00257C2FE2|nr:ATP-binding cassette domain-containing protein [Oceanithermus sp.]
MNDPLVRLRGLGKRYGNTEALGGLDLEVEAGEAFGLLGPNGAGKTTTLRILATLIRPSSGEAWVNGHSVLRDPLSVRRSLGIVNGGMGLYERLTGREILHFFGRFYGLGEGELEARVRWLDELLGLGPVLDKRVEEMSSGMIQKIVVGRAILHRPPVLLLDEATQGLDVFARRALLDFVQEYKAAGHTIVYSTHVLPEAEEVCDRVGFLHRGRLLFVGRVAEAKERYATDSLERAFIRAAEEVPA